MNIVWLSVNSSYSHSSLALPLMHAHAANHVEAEWFNIDATINDDIAAVTAQVIKESPDVLAATAYLFNCRFILEVVHRVRLICPNCQVILGGPQFLGDNAAFLRFENDVTAVVRGEGEIAFRRWLQCLNAPETWRSIPGLCWWDGDDIYHDNGLAEQVQDLDSLPSPLKSCFFDWSKPFVQLETTRGCNGSCSYCTSAATAPIRQHGRDRIKEEIQMCRAHGKREIRLIDRTFNADSNRAAALLRFFRDECSDFRIHLEFHPEFLAASVRRELQAAPDGLLHLEVGLQSTSAEAYAAVRRLSNPDKAWEGVQFLCSLPNIDVHVDLIAGLPGLTFQHLLRDLTELTILNPAEIQLEILKVLPGTPLFQEAAGLGMRFAQVPPYEVLRSSQMTFHELETCRLLSKLLDTFYNSPPLQDAVCLALAHDNDFHVHFLEHLQRDKSWLQPLSLRNRFRSFFDYAKAYDHAVAARLQYLWMKWGLGQQDGLAQAELWKQALPRGLRLLEGSEDALSNHKTRIWRLKQTTHDYWFVYDRSRSMKAVAIYGSASQDTSKPCVTEYPTTQS